MGKDVKINEKSDVNDQVGTMIYGNIKIIDLDTKEVLVNKRA